MKTIDDAAYQRGLRAFTKKATLRSMVEALVAAENKPLRQGKEKLTEEQYETLAKAREQEASEAASALLGFADGFIARIQRM